MFSHPKKVCMSYFQHFKFSMEMSSRLLIGSFQAFVHAVYPDIYITSTSDTIKKIDERIKESGCRKDV